MGSCREKRSSPECRREHEAGRGKDGNEHPPQPMLTFLASRAGGRPDTWVPLTLTVEGDKAEMGNL